MICLVSLMSLQNTLSQVHLDLYAEILVVHVERRTITQNLRHLFSDLNRIRSPCILPPLNTQNVSAHCECGWPFSPTQTQDKTNS